MFFNSHCTMHCAKLLETTLHVAPAIKVFDTSIQSGHHGSDMQFQLQISIVSSKSEVFLQLRIQLKKPWKRRQNSSNQGFVWLETILQTIDA